jgi:hypothetical protein
MFEGDRTGNISTAKSTRAFNVLRLMITILLGQWPRMGSSKNRCIVFLRNDCALFHNQLTWNPQGLSLRRWGKGPICVAVLKPIRVFAVFPLAFKSLKRWQRYKPFSLVNGILPCWKFKNFTYLEVGGAEMTPALLYFCGES